MVKSIKQKKHLERLVRLRKKRRIRKKCRICGKKFSIILSRKDTTMYCSRKCYTQEQKGKVGYNKGKTISTKGKTYEELYGKERAIILKKQRSESAKKRKNNPIINYGKNHWNWKDGISSENNKIRSSRKYINFVKRILKRDNWTCQRCEKRGGNLEVHHWKSFSKYPKLRFNYKNVSTLCIDCHRIVDEFRR